MVSQYHVSSGSFLPRPPSATTNDGYEAAIISRRLFVVVPVRRSTSRRAHSLSKCQCLCECLADGWPAEKPSRILSCAGETLCSIVLTETRHNADSALIGQLSSIARTLADCRPPTTILMKIVEVASCRARSLARSRRCVSIPGARRGPLVNLTLRECEAARRLAR